MARPHKIEVTEMATYFDNHVVEGASATTADQTQRKRLFRKGAFNFIVDRRYLEETGTEVIYSGDDLAEAVRVYNKLS